MRIKQTFGFATLGLVSGVTLALILAGCDRIADSTRASGWHLRRRSKLFLDDINSCSDSTPVRLRTTTHLVYPTCWVCPHAVSNADTCSDMACATSRLRPHQVPRAHCRYAPAEVKSLDKLSLIRRRGFKDARGEVLAAYGTRTTQDQLLPAFKLCRVTKMTS